jgi:AcrR family transcriptional regulator
LIEVAMQIVEKEGVEGLSVRKLASTLGYSTMKLYSECGGKPQLLILMAEEICKQQNTVLNKVPVGDDPIGYLLQLTLASSRYYVDKPWTAQVLRVVRFELDAGEQSPSFQKTVTRYREAMKATKLPGTQDPKTLEAKLNVIRALILGALSLLHLDADPSDKKRVIKIVDDGMHTLIAGWRQK